ncbi:MAG TPA: phosphoribosylformylglycinamidine synthase subunit PurS [Terriglobales bacterium]|nr:phosphoribosylformylglycinamidine synthase subunit PurS [Terriglobales bacterium]
MPNTTGLRPGGSGAGPGNAAGPEAGAPVVVVSRSPRAPDRRSTRRQAGACQKKLASARRFPQHRRGHGAGWSRFDMKARIVITPKKAVVDPQGKAVQNALEHMGYGGINAVHVGKYLEIELNGADRETARRQLDEACHKFLSNPVIEDYKLEIE